MLAEAAAADAGGLRINVSIIQYFIWPSNYLQNTFP